MNNLTKKMTAGLVTAAVLGTGFGTVMADSSPWEGKRIWEIGEFGLYNYDLTPEDPCVWLEYTPAVTSVYEVRMDNYDGADYDIEAYDINGAKVTIEEQGIYFSDPGITMYRTRLEGGVSYHFRAGMINGSITEDRNFFLSVAPSRYDSKVNCEHGGSVTLDATLAGFEGMGAFTYEWVDENSNVLTDTPVCTLSDIDIGRHLTCFVSLEDRIMTSIGYDIVLENHLRSTATEAECNILVTSGSSVTMDPKFAGDDMTGASYHWYMLTRGEGIETIGTEPTLTLPSVSGNCAIGCGVTDRYNNFINCVFYICTFDASDVTELVPDNTYSIDLRDKALFIYEFTPSAAGDYRISSTGDADSYVAVFDADLHTISAHDDIDNSSENYNFDLTTHLEAGKTYYIIVRHVGYYTQIDAQDPTRTSFVFTRVNAPEPAPAVTEAPSVTEAPAAGASGSNVSDFVERLYTIALGRSSDEYGKIAWIEAVTVRGETGADLARGFLYSDEFLNSNVSNEEFVCILYRTFFGREADRSGLEGWVNALSEGQSRRDVIEGFINSTEWANLCIIYGIRCGGTGSASVEVEPDENVIGFATRLYTTCLGRTADQAGMTAWARQLANQRDTGTGAARGFFFSEEFTRQNVSNAEFVNRLYRTFMGREADAAGFNAWVAQLDSGVSREEVFNGFAQSQEFGGICSSYGILR